MTVNDYLTRCIKNNYRCQHCALNHNNVCFFAFECFLNDMKYFKDDYDDSFYGEDTFEESDIPDDVDETNYEPYCGCDMFEICGSIDEEW